MGGWQSRVFKRLMSKFMIPPLDLDGARGSLLIKLLNSPSEVRVADAMDSVSYQDPVCSDLIRLVGAVHTTSLLLRVKQLFIEHNCCLKSTLIHMIGSALAACSQGNAPVVHVFEAQNIMQQDGGLPGQAPQQQPPDQPGDGQPGQAAPQQQPPDQPGDGQPGQAAPPRHQQLIDNGDEETDEDGDFAQSRAETWSATSDTPQRSSASASASMAKRRRVRRLLAHEEQGNDTVRAASMFSASVPEEGASASGKSLVAVGSSGTTGASAMGVQAHNSSRLMAGLPTHTIIVRKGTKRPRNSAVPSSGDTIWRSRATAIPPSGFAVALSPARSSLHPKTSSVQIGDDVFTRVDGNNDRNAASYPSKERSSSAGHAAQSSPLPSTERRSRRRRQPVFRGCVTPSKPRLWSAAARLINSALPSEISQVTIEEASHYLRLMQEDQEGIESME